MSAIRISPLAFVLLLGVELACLPLASHRNPRIARIARLAMCVIPLLLAMASRAYVALSTRGILEWDETYYLSIAITGAAGRGLYPFVFGYGPMAIMGGLGYAAYLYALAVLIAGPTILGLRVVSLVASAVGLACLWLLVRRLYGSGAAWMATAITSALRLFGTSNTVRMDSITFAWVTAGLLVVAVAFERWERRRWHLAAGLLFGLGLQAHIDTVITAAGCGLLYLLAWLKAVRDRQDAVWPAPLLLYVAGWGIGLALFVLFNILPDSEAFYRTTVRIRVDATGWYSGGTSSLLGSFLDPRILIAKQSTLYGVLFHQLHWIEIGAVIAGLVATIARRTRSDTAVLTVVAGVLVAAGIVLNNASPLYFIHVVPALVVPIGALFSHGFTRLGSVRTEELGRRALVAFAVVISALFAVNGAKSAAAAAVPAEGDGADAAYASRVRAIADPGCVVAGDGRLYVRYFADYPFFVSARPTEVSYALLFYGLADDAAYWDIKSPGVVAWRGPLPPGLAAFVNRHRLPEVEEGIWLTDGCQLRQGVSLRRSSRTGISPTP